MDMEARKESRENASKANVAKDAAEQLFLATFI